MGIWLSLDTAIIVELRDTKVVVTTLHSYAGEKPERGEKGPKFEQIGRFQVEVKGQDDSKYRRRLDRYFEQLVDVVSSCDKVYIFGPGEAKKELKRLLCKDWLLERKIVAVETAGRMDEAEAVTETQSRFR